MWADDTIADVLYPTAGLSLLAYDDAEFQFECVKVYNDWLAEFCAVDKHRLMGLAMIPTWDIDLAVGELERCHAMGLRGAIMPSSPPDERKYSFFSDHYEKLWASAEAHGMPISIHILAGHGSKGLANYGKTIEDTFYFGFVARDEIQRTISELIVAGVFERYPNLKMVAAEAGIDYVARLEKRLDSTLQMWWHALDHKLVMKPSEYFRRNVYCTYISDPIGLNNLRFTGSSHFMWSSDYPHGAATWPNSAATVKSEFDEYGVPEAERTELTVTNVAKLYNIDVASVAQPSPAM